MEKNVKIEEYAHAYMHLIENAVDGKEEFVGFGDISDAYISGARKAFNLVLSMIVSEAVKPGEIEAEANRRINDLRIKIIQLRDETGI